MAIQKKKKWTGIKWEVRAGGGGVVRRVNSRRNFWWVIRKHEVFEKVIWNGYIFQTSYLHEKYISGSVEDQFEGSFHREIQKSQEIK